MPAGHPMDSITKNTVFWAAFWILFAVVSIAAVVLIPRQIRQADEQARQAQADRVRTERELRELEQRQIQEMREAEMPKTPDEQRVLAIDNLIDALEVYGETQGSYPVAAGPDEGLIEITPDGQPCVDLLALALLDECPRDPTWPRRGYRYRSLTGSSYELTALLDGDDASRCTYVEGLCIYIRSGELQHSANDGFRDADEAGQGEIGASLYDAISAAYN